VCFVALRYSDRQRRCRIDSATEENDGGFHFSPDTVILSEVEGSRRTAAWFRLGIPRLCSE
jgi:hypothetical protein